MPRTLYKYGLSQRLRRPGFGAIRSARALVPMQRVLPTYLILGGQRCGTTSLQQHLTREPGVLGSFRKEVGFFDSNWARGLGWYQAHFPTRISVERRREQLGYSPAVGEATVYYLFHPCSPRRVRELLPDARLVVLLRNPTARAYSSYQLQCALGTEQLSFGEALAAEPSRLGDSDAMLADGRIESSHAHRHYSYVARGMYANQLKRWLQYFSAEQLLIVDSSELFLDSSGPVARIHDFIGIPRPTDNASFARAQNHLGSASGRIPTESKAWLDERFREPNKELFALLGKDFGWNDR
jgi:lipopolysaccharide transport system ATP-binding protein